MNVQKKRFVVFADDAEVVLPQAHTASQLFGIEKVEGIELEAAAGIPALSQLFLRWLGKFVLLSMPDQFYFQLLETKFYLLVYYSLFSALSQH